MHYVCLMYVQLHACKFNCGLVYFCTLLCVLMHIKFFIIMILYTYIGAMFVESFLEHFQGGFMRCACAKEVASELRRRKVIPESVETKIEGALDRKTANSLFYDHLLAQGNLHTPEITCDVFIEKEAYPRTKQLGESMKSKLTQYIKSISR